MVQVHRLVNKIMCRNLHEYNTAQMVGQPREQPKVVDDDMHEDLGILQGIM